MNIAAAVAVYRNVAMVFADLALAKRLEHAEGQACREFADARRRLQSNSGAAWIECGGVVAVFDGIESPVTQSFGLGLFEEATSSLLAQIEAFFFKRGAAAVHEVSPLAGVATLDLLCARGYRPIEVSSVLHQPVERKHAAHADGIAVRVAAEKESFLWVDLSARGWSHGLPELGGFMRTFGAIAFAREHSVNFIAEVDSCPGAAGTLCLHDGVALFGGAATVPELRRRGLQSALLTARFNYAFEHGSELAMMVTEAGSQSQRNAERKGFQVAYTRTKWRLLLPNP